MSLEWKTTFSESEDLERMLNELSRELWEIFSVQHDTRQFVIISRKNSREEVAKTIGFAPPIR